MKRAACIPWMKYYFPCGRCECLAWTVIIILFGILTFILTMVIALETFYNLEEVPPLRGSGSSFAFPLYDAWFNSLYVNTGLQVTYQPSGVYEGFLALQNSSNSYTFSGGEYDSEDYNIGSVNDTLQFPIVGASVALIFHLPDSNVSLNISMPVLVDLFNGTINNWSDSKLAKLNPSITLPNEPIAPLHFLKENGATFILSSTLSNYSDWWRSHVGYGERVVFPLQTRYPVLDDYDMLETVVQTPYSLGYVLYPSALTFQDTLRSNLSLFNMCTQISNDTCVNSIALTVGLQQKSVSSFTIQSNGVASPPPYNWTCTNCWFFNGFTYWYTEELYTFQSGCETFINNLQTLLNWVYTNNLALSESNDAHFVLLQGTTLSILQSNINLLSCSEGNSKALNRSFILAWVFVGIILFIFLIIIGIRLGIGIFRKHKRLRHSPVAISLQSGAPLEITPLLMSSQIDRKDIVLSTQIGTGSFGEVYKGVWHGTDVAVKRMLLNSDSNQRGVIEDFFQEANLMSTLRHPNVIQFLGACLMKPHLYIVLELAERGSVFDLLGKSDLVLDTRKKLNFCIDAAKGMLYLHSSTPPIIHRDLKTANLLVDQHWRVMVTDFGLSRVVDTQSTMTHCGTVEFCAPEVLKRSRYSVKADVYSFGICVWQIFTRSALFHNTPLYQLMRMVVHDRYRPPLDDKIFSKPLQSLIERCWAHDPEKRPEFDEILKDLIHIVHDRH